jgi:hypothetical protein
MAHVPDRNNCMPASVISIDSFRSAWLALVTGRNGGHGGLHAPNALERGNAP